MHCNNCGREVEDSDKFCAHCGCCIEDTSKNIGVDDNSIVNDSQVQLVTTKTKILKHIFIVLIFFVLISVGLLTIFYTKSPEFVMYKSIIAMKNNDYEKILKYINIDKIIDNRVNEITTVMLNDPSLTNNPFAGLAYALVESLKPRLTEYIKTEFRNIVESPDNIFQETSSFKLLYFTIIKKYDSVSLKEVINEPKKVVFEFDDIKNAYKLQVYFVKNSKNQWEIVDIMGYEFWNDKNAKKLQHHAL